MQLLRRPWAMAVLTLVLAAGPSSAAGFFQGFETDNSGWNVLGGQYDATRVASGTNGVTSKTGGFHGQAGQYDLDVQGGSAFTRWGGYSFTFPPGGWTTSVDIYLDCAYAATAGDKRIDWDSAVNSTSGFRRDFVFNMGTEATGFVISASNNAGRSGANPNGNGPIHVTSSGWYNFSHTFYDSLGALACRFDIRNASNVLIGRWVRRNASDLISTQGGNRYGWFAAQELPFLAFDNSQMVINVPADNVSPVTSGLCISNANPCVNVPVNFNRADATGARGLSVTFQLSANLKLCSTPAASIHQGTWLNGYNTTYQVVDNGGGSYTVDQAILGLPCGQTAGGQAFTIDVKKDPSAGDGTGTITVTATTARDCNNNAIPAFPGNPADVPIDFSAPAAIADLAAQQQKTGNDADGTTKIKLTFTAPGDASVVEVYRAGYSNYPEYDDGGSPGSVPATPSYPPGAPWALTSVTATNQTDEVATRDFYYYVVFTKDGCGNVSAVSNKTSGTLNYHLGDVTNGVTDCQGNNLVNTADISFLGAHYGITLGEPDVYGCLDVGPTTDFSVNTRPTTDNKVNFEDLILFAINYGVVSAPQMANHPVALEHDALSLNAPAQVSAGQQFTVDVTLKGAGDLQGLSAQLGWDAAVVRPVGVEAGAWLQGQNGVVMSAAPGNVDAALLGVRNQGLAGEGVIARVSFVALASGAPKIAVARVDARDAANHPVAFGAAVAAAPRLTELQPVAPNPFRMNAALSFALARPQAVDLSIYGLDGRRIRTLAHEMRAAGIHHVSWNGLDELNQRVHPGVYYARLVTADGQFQRSLVYLK